MAPVVGKFSAQDGIALVVAVLALVLFLTALALSARGRRIGRRGRPDIPPSMQPGPSDADLEKPRLEALQGWAIVAILFLAIWIPIAWLYEPSSNLHQDEALRSEAIERGRQATELFSE